MIGIYKITSPSNKIYIGQSKNILIRFRDYRCDSFSMRKQRALYNSFKKYGVENHKFEIIEECKIENLNIRERYWQDFYDVSNSSKGLNCILTKTNKAPYFLSEEGRRRISEANIGRKFSPESIEKMRFAQKGKKMSKETKLKLSIAQKLNQSLKPRVHSQETKDKISKSHIGKKMSKELIEKLRIINTGKPSILKIPFSKDDLDNIYTLHINGFTQEYISNIYNCSRALIGNKLKELIIKNGGDTINKRKL